MARIRSLKPDCWQDTAVGRISREARLLFIGLITQADDEGRLNAEPRLLRSQIFPLDEDLQTTEVEAWLGELEDEGLIVAYSAKRDTYIYLSGFTENQRISHPKVSKLPPPPPRSTGPPESSGTTAERSALPPERSTLIGREGIGGDRKNPSVELTDELFGFWREKCAHPKAILTEERRRKIQRRLSEGYTEAQIRTAIEGAAKAPFVNDAGQRFDDIELICRSGSKLESFIRRAEEVQDDDRVGDGFVQRLNARSAA